MAGRMRVSANPRAAGVVLGMIGIAGFAVLMLTAALTAQTVSFLRHSARANGVVQKLARVVRKSSRGTPQVSYAPVFSFVTADGRTMTVTSRMSSSPPEFRAGDAVPVRYDPRNPKNARIDTFWQMWGAETITGGLGAVACLVTLACAASLRRRMQQNAPAEISAP
jgi:hypothetical protein